MCVARFQSRTSVRLFSGWLASRRALRIPTGRVLRPFWGVRRELTSPHLNPRRWRAWMRCTPFPLCGALAGEAVRFITGGCALNFAAAAPPLDNSVSFSALWGCSSCTVLRLFFFFFSVLHRVVDAAESRGHQPKILGAKV